MNRFFTSPASILESLADKKAPFRSYERIFRPFGESEETKRSESLEKRSWTQSQNSSVSTAVIVPPVNALQTRLEEQKETAPNPMMEIENKSEQPKKQLPLVTSFEKPLKPKRVKKPIFSSAEKVADVEKVISLSKPEFLDSRNPFINKLMKISVTYKSKDGKSHQKTIFFGSKRKAYYITHKNEYLREASLHKIKGPSNFLEPRFYEMEILDGPSESLEENYLNLVKKFTS